MTSKYRCDGDVCHNIVYYAKRLGMLPTLESGLIPCADCGQPGECYEHRDYNKPLYLEVVCESCNIERGNAVRCTDESAEKNNDALRVFRKILDKRPIWKGYRDAARTRKGLRIKGLSIEDRASIEEQVRIIGLDVKYSFKPQG